MLKHRSTPPRAPDRVYARRIVGGCRRGLELTRLYKSVSSTVQVSHEGFEIVFLLDYTDERKLFVGYNADPFYVKAQVERFVESAIKHTIEQRLKNWRILDEPAG